jgi:DNA mismatch repair ATPase MutL
VSYSLAGNTNKGNNPQSGQPPSQQQPPSQASSSQQQQQQQQQSQQQQSQQQQPQQQQNGSTSWAQAAGKGLPANQQTSTGGSGSSSSSSSNNNTNPGTGSSGSSGANSNTGSNSTKQQLEQLNTMREALFSQDGWGGVSIMCRNYWPVNYQLMSFVQCILTFCLFTQNISVYRLCKSTSLMIFMVAPYINNIKLFIVQLMHTNCIKLLNY